MFEKWLRSNFEITKPDASDGDATEYINFDYQGKEIVVSVESLVSHFGTVSFVTATNLKNLDNGVGWNKYIDTWVEQGKLPQ